MIWMGHGKLSLRREMQMNTRSINPTSLSVVWSPSPCDWPKLITDKFKRPGTGLDLTEISLKFAGSLNFNLTNCFHEIFGRHSLRRSEKSLVKRRPLRVVFLIWILCNACLIYATYLSFIVRYSQNYFLRRLAQVYFYVAERKFLRVLSRVLCRYNYWFTSCQNLTNMKKLK